MSGSRTIPFRSLTITPHIESVCVNNTRTSLTNSDKRASSLLYLGSMASNLTSVSANRSQIISPYKISAEGAENRVTQAAGFPPSPPRPGRVNALQISIQALIVVTEAHVCLRRGNFTTNQVSAWGYLGLLFI